MGIKISNNFFRPCLSGQNQISNDPGHLRIHSMAGFPSPSPLSAPMTVHHALCICLALALAAARKWWSKHTSLWVSNCWWHAPILPLRTPPSSDVPCLRRSPNRHPSSPTPWPNKKLECWVEAWGCIWWCRLDTQSKVVGLWAWWKRRWVNSQFDDMYVSWIGIYHLSCLDSSFQVAIPSTSKQRIWYCSTFSKLVQFGIGIWNPSQLQVKTLM